MTENKRFTNTDNGFIVDYKSEQKVLNLYDVVDVLDELHDENNTLKDLLKSIADHNGEICLNNGQIIRLKKIFKGEF